MADYLPHTPAEIDEMLAFLGMDSLEQLFAHIPPAVRLSQGLDLPDGMSEPDVAALFTNYTSANQAKASSRTDVFRQAPVRVRPRGAGGREDGLAGRSEFVTARLHALPARSRPGRAAGDLRVPDVDRSTQWSADTQRVAL